MYFLFLPLHVWFGFVIYECLYVSAYCRQNCMEDSTHEKSPSTCEQPDVPYQWPHWYITIDSYLFHVDVQVATDYPDADHERQVSMDSVPCFICWLITRVIGNAVWSIWFFACDFVWMPSHPNQRGHALVCVGFRSCWDHGTTILRFRT